MTHTFYLLTFLMLFISNGCGSSSDKWKKDRPKVVPAAVTVSYKGNAVEGAKVYFSLKEGSVGAVSETNSEGVAHMTTFEKGDGVVPGTHLVKVSKVLVESTIGTEKLPDSDDYPVTVRRTSLLPEKYADYKTSGFSVTVTDGEQNNFQFELVD